MESSSIIIQFAFYIADIFPSLSSFSSTSWCSVVWLAVVSIMPWLIDIKVVFSLQLLTAPPWTSLVCVHSHFGDISQHPWWPNPWHAVRLLSHRACTFNAYILISISKIEGIHIFMTHTQNSSCAKGTETVTLL